MPGGLFYVQLIYEEGAIMAHSTANTLIQSEVANLLVKPLESASVFLSMAPRVIDSAVPVRIPTLESSTGAGYVAEAASIPEDDAVFDEVELLPTSRPRSEEH